MAVHKVHWEPATQASSRSLRKRSSFTYTWFSFKKARFSAVTLDRLVPESKLLIIVVVVIFTGLKDPKTSVKDTLPIQCVVLFVYFLLFLLRLHNPLARCSQPNHGSQPIL